MRPTVYEEGREFKSRSRQFFSNLFATFFLQVFGIRQDPYRCILTCRIRFWPQNWVWAVFLGLNTHSRNNSEFWPCLYPDFPQKSACISTMTHGLGAMFHNARALVPYLTSTKYGQLSYLCVQAAYAHVRSSEIAKFSPFAACISERDLCLNPKICKTRFL